jgi:integral membrane protein (TIGR01906 family)
MKVTKAAAYWVFVVCFFLLLFTGTVRLGVNSMHIYEYGFDKYRVSEVTKIDRAQLSEVARTLIDYFNSEVETPQIKVIKNGEEIELFQENEQNCELTHLKDVKALFQVDYLVQDIVLAYVIIYALLFLLWWKGRWQDLAKGISGGCALTLVLIAVIGIASIFINFEQLFIQFHRFAFHNLCWMSTGYLPMLFPESFWQDIAFFGAGAIAMEALLIGSIAWALPFIHQRRKR